MELDRGTALEREPNEPHSAPEETQEKRQRHSRPNYSWSLNDGKPQLALICFEDPAGPIGERAARTAAALAKRGRTVHIFSRRPFDLDDVRIVQHPVGECSGADLLETVDEFGSKVCNRVMRALPDCRGITLLGYEWSSVGAMSTLHGLKSIPYALSLQSLERQRGDLSSEMSRTIEDVERTGLREARSILVNDDAAADAAASVFDCQGRVHLSYVPFPIEQFGSRLDPGAVKARYQVGPVDPVVLYIGDLAEHYGPDLVVKALPAVLKNKSQVRLVVTGCGDLYWPMRVYARYLLLEHAVRFVGDLQGQEMCELICAADMVIVPSRQSTPWWPIQAAWAARKPVVATHPAAPQLLQHEHDSVLCYPVVNSCVWGIEQVLFNEELRQTIAAQGHAKLQEQFGWNMVARQIEELMPQPAL